MMVVNINNENNIYEIKKNIKILESDLPSLKKIDIIYPKTVEGKLLFLEINQYASRSDSLISNLPYSVFSPENKEEREYLELLY